jgi:hypothetical protein
MGDYKHFFDTTWKKSHVEIFSSGVFFTSPRNKLCFLGSHRHLPRFLHLQDPALLANVVEMWRIIIYGLFIT